MRRLLTICAVALASCGKVSQEDAVLIVGIWVADPPVEHVTDSETGDLSEFRIDGDAFTFHEDGSVRRRLPRHIESATPSRSLEVPGLMPSTEVDPAGFWGVDGARWAQSDRSVVVVTYKDGRTEVLTVVDRDRLAYKKTYDRFVITRKYRRQ